MTRAKSEAGNEFLTIASKVSKSDKARIKAVANMLGMSFYELLQSLLLGILRYFDVSRNSTYENNCMMDALFIAIRSLQGSYSPLQKTDRESRRVKGAILFVEDSSKNRPQLLSVSINEDGQVMESLNFDTMVSDFLGCIDPDDVQRLDSIRKELGYFSITHTLHEIIMQRTSTDDEDKEYILKMFDDARIPSGQAINDCIMYKRHKRQNMEGYSTIEQRKTFRADI